MKIYVLLHSFIAHKRQSKRRRNAAFKKMYLWAKGLPLLGANRSTPLLEWPQSCFVSSGRAHLVRPGANCPLQLLALRSHLPWLLASATAGLARAVVWSCSAGDCGAAGTCLAPASGFPPSSLPVARQPLPCGSCACWPLCSEVCGQRKPYLPAMATRRCCVGNLKVCFSSRGLCSQPPLHGQMSQGKSSFS